MGPGGVRAPPREPLSGPLQVRARNARIAFQMRTHLDKSRARHTFRLAARAFEHLSRTGERGRDDRESGSVPGSRRTPVPRTSDWHDARSGTKVLFICDLIVLR